MLSEQQIGPLAGKLQQAEQRRTQLDVRVEQIDRHTYPPRKVFDTINHASPGSIAFRLA